MNLARRVKQYLLRPEAGAGLLYAALATWLLVAWAAGMVTGTHTLPAGASDLGTAWMLVSFAVSVWLAFSLLRRPQNRSSLRRLLLVAIVHAVGAIRFYEGGLVILSLLPLFALVPAWLLPARNVR